MNFIGKLFVMLYGTASLFCLILATAVYTQKMNFVTPKGEDTRKLPPLVEKSIEKTKQLIGANNRAYTRWIQNNEELAKLEVEQFKRREFYSGQLELAQTGQFEGKEVKNPIRQLFDQEALKRTPPVRIMVIDSTIERPPEEVKKGVNAETPNSYIVGIKRINEEMAVALNKILESVKEQAKLTEAINGTDAVKGLRTRIKEQEHVAKIADEERVYLENPITTRRAEAQLFGNRRDALASRIARLESIFNKKPGGQGN